MSNEDRQIAVIGAGPAGLTAAYELRRKGESCIIIESDNVVGDYLEQSSEMVGALISGVIGFLQRFPG